jgi:hypothetical protein
MATEIPEYPPVCQLKITLTGVKPLIWRRILVRGDANLYKLHKIIQIAMGWWDYHLHLFAVDDVIYAVPSPDEPWLMKTKNEKRVRLIQVAPYDKARLEYEYDLGDSWKHDILMEKISHPKEGLEHPICIKGKRSAPPEDCGGVSGYEEFLKAFRNPRHPDHESMLSWAGKGFDPERCDLEEINRLLCKVR